MEKRRKNRVKGGRSWGAGRERRMRVGGIDLEMLYSDVGFMDKQSRTPGRIFIC